MGDVLIILLVLSALNIGFYGGYVYGRYEEWRRENKQ